MKSYPGFIFLILFSAMALCTCTEDEGTIPEPSMTDPVEEIIPVGDEQYLQRDESCYLPYLHWLNLGSLGLRWLSFLTCVLGTYIGASDDDFC